MIKSSGRAVIASRYWPTALSLIRSLGAAGFEVDLAVSVPHEGESKFAASSKYVGRYAETVCKSIKTADDEDLLQALIDLAGQDENSGGELPVLLPADDYTSSLIDRNLDRLKTLYITPDAMGGRQGAITELMNKRTQNRIASECGLPCPDEWTVDLRDISIPDDVKYPCYCKPVISFVGYKGEMAKCSSPDELRDHLEYLKSRNPDREILVQEFLEIDKEISISGASIRSRDGSSVKVVIPAAISKGRPAKYERGVAITGTLVDTTVLGGLVSGIEKLLNTMDYNGMFDMDFHCSGDRIYFGEVNLRSGGTSYAYYLSGVNLPAVMVKGLRYGAEAVGEEETKLEEFGRTFVYEKVLWKDHLQGYLTKKEVKDILANADFRLIDDPSDPVPGELYEKYVQESINKKKKKAVRQRAKKILLPAAKPVKEIIKGYPQYKPGNFRKRSKVPRVMVMGRNYSSNLCMARSLGLAGYDVEIMRVFSRRPAKDDVLATMIPDAYSKYVKAFHTCTLRGKTQNGADALLAVADKNRKMLLIPTDDISAYIADEFYDRLKSSYIMAGVRDTQGELCCMMSKGVQKELAESCGLPVPGSCVVTCSGGRYEIPETVNYPCFIKPDVSCKSSKKRMKKCSSAEELREALDEIVKTAEPDLLIEDYVPIKRELSILGLCADGKVLCPGLIAATSGGHGARRGVAATGVSITPACNDLISESLMENIRTFMRATGYNGLFDIDLVETEDGRIFFLEVNLRYGASGYVVTCEGINLPGMFADYMLKGQPVADEEELMSLRKNKSEGLTFVSEKVLLENYADGAAEPGEIKEAIRSADVHFVSNDTDSKPYRYYEQAFDKIKKKMRAVV